jgi:hypothetical protein
MAGGLSAAWREDTLGKSSSHLQRTISSTGAGAITLAAVSGAFFMTRGIAESVRGKDDVWNNVLGGIVGGSLFGIKSPPPPPQYLTVQAARFSVGVGGALLLALSAVFAHTTGPVAVPEETKGEKHYFLKKSE